MQRYEFSDGKSNKFWQIEQQGSELHIAWGKLGTSGQSQVKAFDDEAKASTAKDKLVKEKTSKGYALADDAPVAASATPKTPAKAEAAAAKPKAPKNEPAGAGKRPRKADAAAEPAASPAGDDAGKPATPAPTDHPSATAAMPPAPPATREAIDAWLTQRREAPGVDEAGMQAWPRALQFIIDATQGKDRVSLTAARLQQAAGADDLSMHRIDALLADSGVLRGWGLRGLSYVDAHCVAQAKATLANAQALADATALRLRPLREQAWAPLAASEPQAAWPARLGQRLQALNARAWPLRGDGPHAKFAKPSERSAKEAWFLLRSGTLNAFSAADSDPAFQPAIDRLAERLRDQAKADPEPDSDQLLLDLCVHLPHENSVQGKLHHIMCYLVQAYGPAQVVRMLAQSTQRMPQYEYTGGRRWGLRERTGSWMCSIFHAPTDGLLGLLRRWLLAADEAAWQAAVQAAIEVMPTLRPEERGWLGPVFAESPELAQAAMASFAGTRSLPKSAQWLLVALPVGTGPSQADGKGEGLSEDAHRLMAIRPDMDGHSLFKHPELLQPLLARLGDEALGFLVQGVEFPTIANLLAMTNEPEAIVALARQAAASKEAQARLRLALSRWPLAGAVGLARLCAQGGKDTPLLLPMLRQTLADLGPAAALVPAWLPPAAQALLTDLQTRQAGPGDLAGADELPPVLRQPPWRQAKKRTAAKAMALAPLPLADAADDHPWPLNTWQARGLADALALAGKADAQAQAETVRISYRSHNQKKQPAYLDALAQAIRKRDADALVLAWEQGLEEEHQRYANSWFYPRLLGQGCLSLPGELGLALWNAKAGTVADTASHEEVLHHWGLRALPGFVRMLRASPATRMADALHFGAIDIAPLAARAAFKLKSVRKLGLRWLTQWPEHAAHALIAPALGKPGEARDVAAKALRFLAANGHGELLRRTAASYGDEQVAQALQAVLDEDPLDGYPSRIPALPAFWHPQDWARPRLTNGKALGDDAMTALGQMLAFPRGDGLYEGLAQVREACTPESLADFGWDLFSAWLADGAPSKDNWAFSSLAILGNDEVARRLTPLIRAWPGESAHARAVAGLDVLEGIGTDTALMLLNGIAQKIKFKGLQDKAREKIAAIAEARGLSTEELEDRLAPDLGLDERGSLVLDFGPRQFKVGFDENLKPWVRDFTNGQPGARLKDLPKPTKADDDAKAKEATERYKLLKKDAKTIASQQIQRLETAMCQQRRWTEANFRDFIATHPLVRHVAQRLIWGVFAVEGKDNDGEVEYPNFGGQLLACFRLAEDASHTNADDEPFELPEAPEGQAIRIGVPHALQIAPEDAQAFGQLFADYELLQPFAQVGRDTYALTEDERAGKVLTRWKGAKVPTGRILGLVNKAWRRGDAQDGGGIWYFTKPQGDGRVIELTFDPGIIVGYVDEEPEQNLGEVTYGTETSWGGLNTDTQREFGELDAISASELIRDMEALREPVK